MVDNAEEFKCGYVTITGRPNVGKSTLLNHFIGQKISITTRKPQTTRHHLLGISNKKNAQVLYVDTPGFQLNPKQAINRYMNREIKNASQDVDVILFVIEALKWTETEQQLLSDLEKTGIPILLIVNKIDRISDKQKLLPFIESLTDKNLFQDIILMSALAKDDVEKLENEIIRLLPDMPAIYDREQLSNRNSRFFAAEFIREKLTQKLGEELPYQLTVTIDDFREEQERIMVFATIWVAKQGQKAIVIGKNGNVLKAVGEQARADMQKLFQQKVHLETWVKVKGKWTDDEKALRQFNYDV